MASEPVEQQTAPPDQTRLALERNRLAYERTLMAWVRTALSFISFGFTIYEFFQYVRENQPGESVQRLVGPRTYGIGMISIGVFALLLATWQHRQDMQGLHTRTTPMPPCRWRWCSLL